MDWLVCAVEKDLGIDRRQVGAGARQQELIALVPVRWLAALRDRKLVRFVRLESISEAEIRTYLQCSQAKLPPGWTRVCIQGLRKSKLSYRLVRDPCLQLNDSSTKESYVSTMQHVSLHNVRNLWREAHSRLVQPYAGASEQMHVTAADAVRHSLQKLFKSAFISCEKASPSLSPAKEKENILPSSVSASSKPKLDHLCPNVLSAECLLETAEMLYVVLPYTQYSLHDLVSFSPAKLANSHAKVLFILYQLLTAMQACHTAGLSCGDLSLLDIAVDEQLCSRLKVNLAHYEELGNGDDPTRLVPKSAPPRVNVRSSQENKMLCKDCFDELKTLVLDWVHGRVSNFCYLMELNRLAGRREGDPNYHPVLPWVVDFTVPFGKFRDLRRSKFRLNKGDKQLDFTYEMTKEALAAAAGSGLGGVSVGGDLCGSVSASGAGQPDHLHVPHHVSDVLSDITYYVYKARQTPKWVLCSHVRSQWEPNEYPSSMERMQSWTPDECIPEFYTDPSIFRSIHPDMPDLDVPSWCQSCEEFIEVHRRLLESREVSQNLHHWIDLNFGFKLSGKDAVKAKNVCLHLVDNHTHLTTYGVVQLFDQPHPPRLSAFQYAPAEPPLVGLAALDVPSLHIPQIDMAPASVDGMVPESTGCESSAWTVLDRDEELEQGTEALDSLVSTGSSNSATCSGPLPSINTGKIADAALIMSHSPTSFSSDFTSAGVRSTVLQRGGPVNKKHMEGGVTTTNADDNKIRLPEGFNPLQPLEELEKLNNFLVKSLHTEVLHPEGPSERELGMAEAPLSLMRLYERDMQALGVLIAEMFYSSKFRGLKPGASLRQRFHAVLKMCSLGFRDIPLSLHHALEKLLPIEKQSGAAHQCQRPLLFNYDPICDGLPPPTPSQILNTFVTPFPFPSYFSGLHRFIFSYHAKMETVCRLQGRDVVFQLWQQLETLLRGNMTAEGLEILLPFILALMLEESTAVYAAWYLFEPISRVLGPRNANKYLLKPLVNVFENPRCLRGRFYLYTDCFILQLIVRLGLQAFLSNLLPHVLLVLTGFESWTSSPAGEACKGMRGANCTLGEEEEEGFQAGHVRSSSGSIRGNMGGGSGASAGVGVVGDGGLVDYTSCISLNDQVFLSEAEDFQNEFYVNGAGGDGGKRVDQNSAAKDQDHESLSVGKLSDKSSASEHSSGDGDSMRDRASLKSADSSQDLKQASEGEEGAELDEEEATQAHDCKVAADDLSTPKLELSFSGCTEVSCATVATVESEFVNGMVMEEKVIMGDQEEEEDQDPSEESQAKEQKILLDTVCKTVRWLSAKLGPTVTSRCVARNLLRLLTNCYLGPESHQFVVPGPEESPLESVGMGSVYEKRSVVGDQTASSVLDCLIYVAQLYGEPVLTYQYLPYIGYLVSPPSSQRLNTRKEASLLGAVALTQKIVVFLSDTTLMDMLMKINQDVLLPLLDLLTNPHMGFPSGGQTRTVVCLKTLSLMALICLRIGREMVQQHMADTLRRYFAVFSLLHCLRPQMESAPRRVVGEVTVVDVSTPEESGVTYELSVLEELQSVFSTEMAHASYIPFYCLIGDMAIRKLVPNHELVWQLASSYHQSVSHVVSRVDMPPSSSSGFSRLAGCSPFLSPSTSSTQLGDHLPESGTFGSHLVGNRIQVSGDSYYGGSLASSWGRSNHTATINTAPSAVTTPFIGTTPFSSSWVMGPPPEDSALKQELSRSGRSLQGNWLAYWQYEIGLNQQDSHFHFHQIRLQSFLGHSGAIKCLAPLAGEDYFLSGGKDRTVKLWPLYNRGDGTQEVEPRLTYSDHRKSVFYVGQLETSQEVVSCDGMVHLWDQYTGRQIRSYEAVDGKNPITAVTTMPAPHGSVLFGSADSVLRFIDPRKPGLQHEFRLAYNNISAGLIRYLAVSPTGRTIAAGFSSGFIVLLDARTGLVLRGWPAHEGDILQMKAAEGNLVISSSTDYTLAVWKDLEQKPLRLYKSQSDPVHALDFYNSEIVTGTMANKVGVYSVVDISLSPVSSTKLSSENFRGTLTSLAVLPIKRLLLLGSDNGAIRLLA
ncbi:WD repeat-containing protein 81 [Hippocampus zosterae]|uniref:WD repeat-containing protein 81 n=1 Tax=Hippocampus zosterae TaxID=109293 RepID=UPI00223DB1FE|nr:WD repeat-containing protein 81 [Hippocampus zosterae]XP_051933386.1 WD repeat-containing protein 81 [Hippocampus zosterae]XP_051933387.1 WD repeat-containing protein 81 [Hippocampus zosterae]